MDTIETMRAFVAVARQRSFTDGARQLEMSTKLVSKYVRQLEERLGAQLLHRTTRSVTLTETGEAYFTRCIAFQHSMILRTLHPQLRLEFHSGRLFG